MGIKSNSKYLIYPKRKLSTLNNKVFKNQILVLDGYEGSLVTVSLAADLKRPLTEDGFCAFLHTPASLTLFTFFFKKFFYLNSFCYGFIYIFSPLPPRPPVCSQSLLQPLHFTVTNTRGKKRMRAT